MDSRLMIISKVAFQYPTQMLLAKDNHMIQTLASDRADEPLHIWSLPRTVRRSDYFLNLYPFHPASKLRSVDRISIPEQISRRGVIGKCFDDLLSGPLGCRMLGHVEMNDLPAP